MTKQKNRLVDLNIKISEETKHEMYKIANERTIEDGKTVSIASIGRNLLALGLREYRKVVKS